MFKGSFGQDLKVMSEVSPLYTQVPHLQFNQLQTENTQGKIKVICVQTCTGFFSCH
jgi:hypothetical protein